jgi:hypothetical protein
VIDWTAPADNGSPITSYQILIQKSDYTTYATTSDCDGSESAIKSALQCTIPVATLLASPFNHVFGNEIYAAIIATNSFGSSVMSLAGNGGVLITLPDAPIQLAENVSLRSATSISLTWDEGINSGGDAIIDYRISMA